MAVFKVALTNVPFDNDYRNNIRFANREQQESAFNIPTIFNTAFSVNFAAGNLLTPAIYYRVPDDNSINDLLSYNYCVVENNQPNATLKYLYYFVINSSLDSGNQIKLELEMDLIQTYYLDLTFSDSFIFKAHLNRFIFNTSGTVKFDSGVDSKLFVREDFKSLAKRPLERKKLVMKFNTGTSADDLGAVLDSMIYCWVYIYCYKKEDGYKFFGMATPHSEYFLTAQSNININRNEADIVNEYTNPYVIFCYPIYKTLPSLTNIRFLPIGENQEMIGIDASSFRLFLKNNGGESNVMSIKFSITPPFEIADYQYGTDWEISGNYLIFKGSNPNDATKFKRGSHFLRSDSSQPYGLIFVGTQYLDKYSIISNDIDISDYINGYGIRTIFTKNEIITSDYNVQFNPKLLSYDFQNLSLTNDIDNYEYDIFKLGWENNILNVIYSEVLTPDITRGYARIAIKGGVYNLAFNNNFRGLVFSQDSSQPYSVNNLEAFMSQNKNFYMQRNVNIARDAINSTASIAGSLATGNVLQASLTAVTSVSNIGADYVQSNLTLDNMRSAPEDVKNANGNIMLNLATNELALYLDHYSALPSEIKIAADFMNIYGFNYNQYDNIKNVDNIRKYFNYVRADVETITAPINISNKIHNKIRDIFRTGIRLWNWIDGKTFNNLFDYTKENYENWLEN